MIERYFFYYLNFKDKYPMELLLLVNSHKEVILFNILYHRVANDPVNSKIFLFVHLRCFFTLMVCINLQTFILIQLTARLYARYELCFKFLLFFI
jgi:hypothetical protein